MYETHTRLQSAGCTQNSHSHRPTMGPQLSDLREACAPDERTRQLPLRHRHPNWRPKTTSSIVFGRKEMTDRTMCAMFLCILLLLLLLLLVCLPSALALAYRWRWPIADWCATLSSASLFGRWQLVVSNAHPSSAAPGGLIFIPFQYTVHCCSLLHRQQSKVCVCFFKCSDRN